MIKPIEDSIYILNKINYKIQDSINIVIELDKGNSIDEEVIGKLFYYMMDLGMILTVSYLDELNKNFSPALRKDQGDEFSKSLMKIINVPKTLIEEKFPDLRALRNNFLAHNMRIDKQAHKNIVLDGDLRKYKVPQNTHDYIFLTSCVKAIDVIIHQVFPKAFMKAESYRLDTTINIPYQKPQFETFESITTEINKIGLSVNNEIMRLKAKVRVD